MNINDCNIFPDQLANLQKLADYLDSLPSNYKHFDMGEYLDHDGECVFIPQNAAAKGQPYLDNCGTIACAIGHGPAAGIPLNVAEVLILKPRPANLLQTERASISWNSYAERAFGAEPSILNLRSADSLYEFLFSGSWADYDNHHYGAAARIKYVLAGNNFFDREEPGAVDRYKAYRKQV